jgi:hypothetical protein
MRNTLKGNQGLIAFVLFGSILGVLVIHPVAMMASWFEVSTGSALKAFSLLEFVRERFWLIFQLHQLPMGGIYAAIGGAIGLGFGLFSAVLHRDARAIRYFEGELARNIPSLIAAGESERVEFKASVRWDYARRRVNRSLENMIAKTLAGFFNHQGGMLLIGVADTGEVLGLENDLRTLRHQNHDGFQRCVTDIVKTRLGGDLCTLLHFAFHCIDGTDVCLVAIEPARRPVYVEEDKVAKFYIRAGNCTRELNVREAMSHAAGRWPPR